MSFEASDMNDQDILTRTTQEPDGKGNARFKYTLPDGHTIVSEWISPDNKKKALYAWIDVVKQTAVMRYKEAENERNAKLRRKEQEEDPSKNSALAGLVKQDDSGYQVPFGNEVKFLETSPSDLPKAGTPGLTFNNETGWPRTGDIQLAAGGSVRIVSDPVAFAMDQRAQHLKLAKQWELIVEQLSKQI